MQLPLPLLPSLSSLAFSPYSPSLLLSSSLTQQVDFWSLPLTHPPASQPHPSSHSSPQYRVQTKAGLRWADFTPFGSGLLTLSTEGCSVDLWRVGRKLGQAGPELLSHLTEATPVVQLVGHEAAVTHVQWYSAAIDAAAPTPTYAAFTLSPASQHTALLIHTLSPSIRAGCGDDDALLEMDGESTVTGVEGVSFPPHRSSTSLHAELQSCSQQLAAFRYHSFSPLTRSCHGIIASAEPSHALHVLITFPPSYPTLAPPVFSLLPSSSPIFLDPTYTSSDFLRELSHVALATASHHPFSLLPPLLFLCRFAHDTVLPLTPTPSPIPPPSTSPTPAFRKQVRIDDRARLPLPATRPLDRAHPSGSFSTPSLSSIASSLDDARLSSSLSLPEEEEEEEEDAEDYTTEEGQSEEGEADAASPPQRANEGEEGGAAQERPSSSKEKERRDFELPCPHLCGVSWGPRGELVQFSNFPLAHALPHCHPHAQAPRQPSRLLLSPPSSLRPLPW